MAEQKYKKGDNVIVDLLGDEGHGKIKSFNKKSGKYQIEIGAIVEQGRQSAKPLSITAPFEESDIIKKVK